MTEIRVIKTEANPDPFGVPTIDVLYLTNFRYDEDCQSQFSETAKAVSPTGNRVRKVRYKYTGSDPDPVFVTEGSNPSWSLQSDEFYVRDVSGKEIAIYSGSSLTQWNIWGLDNVGKINADTTRNYYLKDHLGSIRVVLNSTNTVVSAQDYDAWGYPLENRTYNSSAMKYDFICLTPDLRIGFAATPAGKERDDETGYDYFGARYYDSRIGRWGGVDKMSDMLKQYSPYSYTICNPLKFIDPTGNIIELPENETQRNAMLKVIKFGLPAEFEDYIDYKIDDDGKYVINQDLLNEASTIISGSEEFNSFVDIVNSSEVVSLNFSLTGDKIERISSNKVTQFEMKEYVTGLTVASGNIPNSNNRKSTSFSTSGKTEVYLNATKSLNTIIETLAHELYGHVSSYLKGERWQHGKVNDSYDQKISQIMENSIYNFMERSNAKK